MNHFENTIFYTFSTTVQVIATIVAIIASFVFFLMQSNREKLSGLAQNYFDVITGRHYGDSIRQIFRDTVGDNDINEFRNSMISRDYQAIYNKLEIFHEKLSNSERIKGDFKTKLLDFKVSYGHLMILQEKIRRQTWLALIYSTSNILFTIVLLSLTSCMTISLSITLIIIVIILLAINLLIFINLIRLLF